MEWWKRAVVYQIYPRSFQDSGGDGNGDLRGVRTRLDYLQWHGVDAIWLSLFYQSPQIDGGYDVSDYKTVDPMFGTLADFDELVAEVHRRRMRIIAGFVPNHTSDQHMGFVDSRSSQNSAHADWYVWRDAHMNGNSPNNWLDPTGSSAWTWCPTRGQVYFHSFFPQQPDVNWRNPEVRRHLLEAMTFWLERDVDGFRLGLLWCTDETRRRSSRMR